MPKESTVLVVADDLTGANATGARFARAGLRSATVTSVGMTDALDGFDAVIVSTDSRHLDPAQAAARVTAVVEEFPEAALVIKRTDTTLRGNVSAETAAVLAAVRRHHPGQRVRGLVVPAYPTSGRVTVDGMQLLDGVPLERTELRHDAHNPMHTSSVGAIVSAQAPLTYRHVTLGTVLADAEELHRALLDGEEDLVICDALEELHIQAVAQAAARATAETGVRWVGVDPGPAGAFLARELGLGGRHAVTGPPLLGVIGSITDISVRQSEYLARSELVTILDIDAIRLAGEDADRLTEEQAVAELSGQIVARLRETRFPAQVVLRTVAAQRDPALVSPSGRARLPLLLARAVLRALDSTPVSGLYSSGGDITAAILDSARVRAFEVVGEVIPLAVYGTAIGGDLDGLPVVTKGGLIGTEVTAEACMNQLRTLAESRLAVRDGEPVGR